MESLNNNLYFLEFLLIDVLFIFSSTETINTFVVGMKFGNIVFYLG